MIKMIATDLDGTMLKNDWSVSGINAKAVETAQGQGSQVDDGNRKILQRCNTAYATVWDQLWICINEWGRISG